MYEDLIRELRSPYNTLYGTHAAKQMESAADAIEALQAKVGKAEATIDEHAYKVQMFPQLYEENKNLKDENFRLRIYKDAAVHLAGRLVALCNPPKDMNDKLFRRHINRPGDYMGSGYDFIDGFNRVFDEFEQVADEQLYRAVRDVVEYEIQKWRGPDGRGEDIIK